MTQPADHTRHGFELLRDHRATLPPDRRNVTGGARVVDDGAQPELADVGDKINHAFWPAADAAEQDAARAAGERNRPGPEPRIHTGDEPRAIGGWSMAWPSELQAVGLLPKRGARELDARFRPLRPATDDDNAGDGDGDNAGSDDRGPRSFAPIHGRPLPGGVTGLLTAGTDEGAQRNVFLPVPELVAHHTGSAPPIYSTPVHDIRSTDDGGSELDTDRAAGLHGHLRVAQLPTGGPLAQNGEPTPAWNLGRSTGDATGYGAWVTSGTPTGAAGPSGTRNGPVITGGASTLGAFASHEASGPLHPGAASDKHRIGVSPDGRAWNSGHIDTRALFYADPVHDGPLRFEPRPYPGAGSMPIPVKVHLVWDDGQMHPWVGGARQGQWRWYSTTAIRRPFIPWKPKPDGIIITRTPDEPGEPLVPYRGRGSDLIGPPRDAGDGGSSSSAPPTSEPELSGSREKLAPQPGQPLDPARLPWEVALPSIFGQAVRRQHEGAAGMPYDGRFGGPPVDAGVTDDDLGTGLFPGHRPEATAAPAPGGSATTNAEAAADDWESRDPDWNADNELTGRGRRRREHQAATGAPETAVATRAGAIPDAPPWTQAPLVWHIQSFGASDDNGDWTHTNEPGAYYLGGTSHGGALFGPPEVLLDGADPDTVSDAAFVLYNGHAGGNAAKLGWGIPDQSDGSFADGFFLQASGAAGSVDSVQKFVGAGGSARLGTHTLQGLLKVDVDGGGGTGAGIEVLDSGNADMAELNVFGSTGSPDLWLSYGGNRRLYLSISAVRPGVSNETDLGLSSRKWKDVYLYTVQADDGSAAAPAYTFDADDNTGLCRPGADQIGFTAGGTERMRLTSAALKPQGNGTDLGAASDAWGDGYFSGKLTVGGLIDPTGLVLSEQSGQPHTTTAGELGLWVTDDSDQRLIAEDDAGTEHVLAGPRQSSVTIASGGITLPDHLPDWAWVEVSPQGGAADNLDVITGGSDAWAGQKIILSATGNTVTVRTKSVGGETGANIVLVDDASANNITLAGPDDRLALMRDASGDWVRLFDSDNTP